MERIILGAAALFAGLYFAGCEVFGTYDFLVKDQGSVNYIVFAGSGIAAAVSLLPAWATLAWRGRKFLATTIWVLFWLSLVSVIGAAVWRTGSTTDRAQASRIKTEATSKGADQARDDAKADVERAEKALAEARQDVRDNAAKKTCAENCAKLLADAVALAQKNLDDARHGLASANTAVAAAAPPQEDSFAKRMVAVIPFLTEDQVRTYHPILIPALTSALSAALLALGIWAMRDLGQSFAGRKKGEKKSRATSNDEPLAVSAPAASGAQVLPLAVEQVAASGNHAVPLPATPVEAAADSEGNEAGQQEPTGRVLPQRPPMLQIVGPGEKLVAFASACIEREDGAITHMRAARRAYVDFCAERHAEPMDLTSFAQELAALCQRTGTRVRVLEKDVFLVGARLVG